MTLDLSDYFQALMNRVIGEGKFHFHEFSKKLLTRRVILRCVNIIWNSTFGDEFLFEGSLIM